MTTKELINSLGKKGIVKMEGLEIFCQILDVKQSYGKTRFLITPDHGSGEKWIDADRFYFNN